MDILTFISEVIKAVAWPIMLVVVLLSFRRRLGDLLPLLRKLRLKDFEIEFAEKVENLKDEAPRALRHMPARTASASEQAEQELIRRLAEISPRSAVVEAWRVVEKTALDMLRATRTVELPSDRLPPSDLGKLLRVTGVLDADQVWLFNTLRRLRNRAVHEEMMDVDRAAVLDYIDIANGLTRYFIDLKEHEAPNNTFKGTRP
jgi:hypothetical protein